MKERGSGRIGAMSLAAIAGAVAVLLGFRYTQLGAQIRSQSQDFAQARGRGAVAIANRLALPPNRQLAVCNDTPLDATIAAVTSVYIGQSGKPATYSSANERWRTWSIPAGSRLAFDAPGWDGSALFYAIDVDNSGTNQLLAGISDDLSGGCIRLREDSARSN